MISRFGLIIRYLLFCLFFTVGAGAITLSILIDPELGTYFRNRQMLAEIQRENDKISSLTAQYQSQIDLIRSEPNVLARLERVTFGRTFQSNNPQIPNLPAENQALKEAAQSILAEIQDTPPPAALPAWFERCRQPNTRTALFAAGAGLILITFLFFGTPGSSNDPPKKRFSGSQNSPFHDPDSSKEYTPDESAE